MQQMPGRDAYLDGLLGDVRFQNRAMALRLRLSLGGHGVTSLANKPQLHRILIEASEQFCVGRSRDAIKLAEILSLGLGKYEGIPRE